MHECKFGKLERVELTGQVLTMMLAPTVVLGVGAGDGRDSEREVTVGERMSRSYKLTYGASCVEYLEPGLRLNAKEQVDYQNSKASLMRLPPSHSSSSSFPMAVLHSGTLPSLTTFRPTPLSGSENNLQRPSLTWTLRRHLVIMIRFRVHPGLQRHHS